MPQLVQKEENLPLFTKGGFSNDLKGRDGTTHLNTSSPHSNLLIIFPGLELVIKLLRMVEEILRGGGRNSKIMKSSGMKGEGVAMIKS